MSGTLRDTCLASLEAAGKTYQYYSLAELAKTYPSLRKLPFSLKVLLENLLRNEDALSVTTSDIEALANWSENGHQSEIAFRPSRILLQDFTGVPAVVDLAAMREVHFVVLTRVPAQWLLRFPQSKLLAVWSSFIASSAGSRNCS